MGAAGASWSRVAESCDVFGDDAPRLGSADVTSGSLEVLVVGATGRLGSAVCRSLAEGGDSVRALIRFGASPSVCDGLRALGVAEVRGDLEQPGTLARCLDGVDVVISTASSFPHDPRPNAIDLVDRQGQLTLMDAAEATGVQRVVYLSFPPAAVDSPFQRAKREVEDRLRVANLEHSILQPGNFMDVWFTQDLGLDIASRSMKLYGGGLSPLSWIAVADVASVVVRAVRDQAYTAATVAFGNGEALSQSAVLEIVERLRGESFEGVEVRAAEIEHMRVAATNPTEESIACILLDVIEPSILPSPPGSTSALMTVEQFVAEALLA